MRSRANSTVAGAPVGRRAVVGLRRQVAEDEVDVGADREQLRRHRAPAAADRHARRDRREVGAQHAGVDELAGQQPVEVVVPGRGDAAAGDRDDVGGRAADVDAAARPGARRATASAVATQLAAATSHGRARAAATDTSSPAVVSTLSGRSPSAASAASSTNATPSRLVRNASESSAVIVIATASAGPPATSATTSRSTAASASRSRQTSNGRETVRSDVAVQPRGLRVRAADVHR